MQRSAERGASIEACKRVVVLDGVKDRARTRDFFRGYGSARETTACLHVCVATRLLSQVKVDADLMRLDRIIAGLYRLCHKRSA